MNGGNPAGNIGELIKSVFGANNRAINIISSGIGAISDIGGAVQAVIGLYNLITGQDPLQPVLDELRRDFDRLFRALEARRNEEDWRNLASLVSAAEAVVETLEALVNAQPPPTETERINTIQKCLDPLEALSDPSGHPPSSFFLAVYSETPYWTDAGQFRQQRWVYTGGFVPNWQRLDDIDVGYGQQAPPVPADNQVFSYLYVLPYYLKAVFIFIAVGSVLFADFGKTGRYFQGAVIRYANFLTTIHDLIVGDITPLTPALPPTFPFEWADTLDSAHGNEAIPGVTGHFEAIGPSTMPQLTGISFEWGAVEQFSGFNSIKSSGTPTPVPILTPNIEILNKLRVRALREVIKVYAGVGLPAVWAAINSLNKIADQAPIPPHKYTGWSFREIFSQADITPPFARWRADGLIHLSDVASFIRRTPPLDTAQTGPVSWRNLLEP